MIKNISKKIIVAGIMLILAIIARVFLSLSYDEIVIQLGLSAYRTMSSIFSALLFISIGFGGYTLFQFIRGNKQKTMDSVRYEEEQRASIEQNKKRESYLSASSHLTETILRNELAEKADGEWKAIKDELMPLYEQSIKMDGYQERLENLLRINDASTLDDTVDVLDKAEQSLLKNIRKILNYMEACDSKSKDDRKKICDYAAKYISENDVLLKNVSDFVFALTEYLNNQGSNEGLSALNDYKDILLSAVKSDSGEREKQLVF